ncbi:hypothetical protein [Microcoleus sp. B4-D4]|uniref:hypothetical protein n=1 Tax=Microcoleus sp. B4-D4 TaxID=2818667 RepID=UPI002FD3AF35
MIPTTDIVQKLWNLCHVVRDNESFRYLTSPYNLHFPTLHPEPIAFFDLKSRNNDCDLPT